MTTATGGTTSPDNVVTVRDVPVGEHTFHLLESGDPDRETVLWLHGSGPGANARSNWDRALTDLAGPATGLHHLAPDMLGFGDSTHPDPPPPSAAEFARFRMETLLGLLDELGLERVHLVGNSMGGIIGLGMALKAPERIGRIVLMGGGGAPVPPTDELLKLVLYYEDPTVGALTELIRTMTYDPSVLGDSLERIAAERMPMVRRPEVRRSHLATFAPGSLPGLYSPEQLATIQNPVLVIHGREDRLIPVQAACYFGEHLPNAQVHILPKAGHWAMVEQPERFAALVGSFLTGRI